MKDMTETRVQLRVSQLLEKRGWGPMDLIRRPEFSFSPATAYRLARNDADGISFDVLEKLCRGFQVELVDIIVRAEEESSG